MSGARSVTLLAAVVLPASLGGAEKPEKPRPDAGLYEISFNDGRQVELRLLTEAVEITTRYGKLKVPLADVRRIELGARHPEEARKQAEAAVARLGADDF
jgi:hypothetical protein